MYAHINNEKMIYSRMCYSVEMYVHIHMCNVKIMGAKYIWCYRYTINSASRVGVILFQARIHTWNFVAKMPKFIQTFYPFQKRQKKGMKGYSMCGILLGCARGVLLSIHISIDCVIEMDPGQYKKNSFFFIFFFAIWNFYIEWDLLS